MIFVLKHQSIGISIANPNKPPNKRHRRSTYGDARFGPDHPICGIDWYDAIAFARAALDLSLWANPQAPQGNGALRAFGKVPHIMKDW